MQRVSCPGHPFSIAIDSPGRLGFKNLTPSPFFNALSTHPSGMRSRISPAVAPRSEATSSKLLTRPELADAASSASAPAFAPRLPPFTTAPPPTSSEPTSKPTEPAENAKSFSHLPMRNADLPASATVMMALRSSTETLRNPRWTANDVLTPANPNAPSPCQACRCSSTSLVPSNVYEPWTEPRTADTRPVQPPSRPATASTASAAPKTDQDVPRHRQRNAGHG